MPELRLLIADDHQLLIDGMLSLLREAGGYTLLEPVNDGRALLEKLAAVPVDVVLLDLNMPHLDGIRALEKIRRLYPKVRILVLTNYNQPQLVAEVQRLGANGYLLKSASASELQHVIRHIAEGGTWFQDLQADDAPLPSYFLDEFMKKYHLTKREVEIIRMVGSELTSKEIGSRLSISEFTVNTHRKNIMRKLEVRNIAGILNFARTHGLL